MASKKQLAEVRPVCYTFLSVFVQFIIHATCTCAVFLTVDLLLSVDGHHIPLLLFWSSVNKLLEKQVA